MTQKTLYTGGGVSLSPLPGENRAVSSYVRLIADIDMAITDGTIITTAIDVPVIDIPNWGDCAAPMEGDGL